MKSGLTDEICKCYCQYYKPSKEEDIACMGFIIAERLVERGIPVFLTADPGAQAEEGGSRLSGEDTSEKLRNLICPVCPFYENDCDFISLYRDNSVDVRQVTVRPCGGFIFLGLLLDRKAIDFSDIKQVI